MPIMQSTARSEKDLLLQLETRIFFILFIFIMKDAPFQSSGDGKDGKGDTFQTKVREAVIYVLAEFVR